MNLRQRIYAALTAETAWTDLVPAERLYEASAVPEETIKPYAVLTYGLVTPGVGGVNVQTCDLYVHDDPGSYTRIQDILKASLAPMMSSAGELDSGWLSSVEYRGESADLYDPPTRTILRFRTYRFVGSGV